MIDEKVIYLNTNQVIVINTMQINVYSPKEQIGVKEPALLDSAIKRPMQTILGRDAYPSIYEKAAALTESLAKNPPFHNANKRTTLASLIIFLKLNDYEWTMDVYKEQDFIVNLVTNKIIFEEMVNLIKEHTRKNSD
jgi:death on curing protein